MGESPPPQVFLSHSSRDGELVGHVKRALEQAGSCRVYLAEDHPQPGEHLPTKLLSAIKASVGFVVLLTEDGAKSTLVHQEIGAAGSIGLPVVAVAAPGVATDSNKLGLLAGQELMVFDPANPAPALLDLQCWFQKLPLEAARALPSHAPVPAPVPQPTPAAASLAPGAVGGAAALTMPTAADRLMALALILILAGIALYAITVASQSRGYLG